jgi:hypothetical protein
MKQLLLLVIPIAVLGSSIVVAATLFQYFQAYRLGEPGGYIPIIFGAGGIGFIAGIANFLFFPKLWLAIIIFLIVMLITANVLIATLIWAFGS